MSPDLRKTLSRFQLIDGLFFSSQNIWQPTFFLYLLSVLPTAGWASLVMVVTLLLTFALDVPLGALSDTSTRGQRTFYIACIATALSSLVYALVPTLGADDDAGLQVRLLLVCIAELGWAIGWTFLSGAFDRWFHTTMELQGYSGSPQALAGSLHARRQLFAALSGAIGIVLFAKWSSTNAWLWNPMTWACCLGVVAFLVALWYSRTGRLDRKDLPVPETDSAVPRDAWRIYCSSPELRASSCLSGARTLVLTVLAFVWPVLLWDQQKMFDDQGTSESHDYLIDATLSLILFWLVTRVARALGSKVGSRGIFQRRQSVVLATVGMGLAMSSAGLAVDLLDWISQGEARELRFAGCILGLGAVIGFLIGVTQPADDNLLVSYSPPEFRSVLGSFRSSFGSLIAGVSLMPMYFIGIWHSDTGAFSFSHLFIATGSVTIGLGLIAAPGIVGTPLVRWNKRTLSRIVFARLSSFRPSIAIGAGLALWVLALLGQHSILPNVAEIRQITGVGTSSVGIPGITKSTHHAFLAAAAFVTELVVMGFPVAALLVVLPHLQGSGGQRARTELSRLVVDLASWFHEVLQQLRAAALGLVENTEDAKSTSAAADALNGIAGTIGEAITLSSADSHHEDSSTDLVAALVEAFVVPDRENYTSYAKWCTDGHWTLSRGAQRKLHLTIKPEEHRRRFDEQGQPGEDQQKPLRVWGARRRITLALREPIRNAIHHGEGDVHLDIYVAYHTVWVKVRDFGPGFPAEDPNHFFQWGRRQGVVNHGVGLGICSELEGLGIARFLPTNHPEQGAIVRIQLERCRDVAGGDTP